MPPRFSADDYYDPADDDGEDDWDDYDDKPAPPKKPAAPAGRGAAAAGRGAAAPGRGAGRAQPAASALGKALAPGRGAGAKQTPMPPPSASSGSAQAGAFSFTTPSPDDAVRAAQAGRVPGAGLGGRGAGRGAAAPPPAAAAPVVAQAAAALGRMSITPPSAAPAPAAAPAGRPWSEYVPEAWEAAATAASSAPPPPLHLVCLGHVDAGKSTAMGRLLHEVGAVSAAAVASHARGAAAAGKSSFAWAWALDERPEERARGLTVDVALARFATPMGRAVVLLDAPGHRDFVPAALAGAARADAAVLMLDATPGAFEAGFAQPGAGAGAGGGQTREHAALARACGVSHLIVAVNKLDTCGWAQERYDAIRAEASPALRAAGWRDAAVTWLPLAGREGVNLSAPVAGTAHPLASWWRGPSLLGAVDALPPRPPPPPAPLRLPVWDLLSGGVRSLGPNAAGGKLESGALRPGMQVLLQPAGVIATVKALEADGTPLAAARAGDAVEVGLSGLADGAALSLGTVLCSPGWAAPVAARLTARVTVLDSRMPLLRGATVTLHVGAGREPARVAALLTQLDPATGEQIRARPRCLARGHAGVVEIIPERPLVAERYADCRALGRLALREGGRTLAVGVVLDIWPEVEAATQ